MAFSASAAATRPSKAEVLSLFRSLLRTARLFPDYNIKAYTKRRTIDGFRHNQNLSDPSSIASALSDGKAQLEIARRQAIVHSLYAPTVRSIMETNSELTC
ncbi:LYR motif-containing protein 4B-like [Neltuma alba]|uniref:LYR motif-containing protein 4B-like n=1 Tax=Neltuma alba TaxID=207710 RepID=UPI0010A54526|nr:LYR motif-containing protein 4B-like [Prosopis alba]